MPRHPRCASTVSSLSRTVYSTLAAKARQREGPCFPLHVGDTWLEPYPAARAEAQRTAEHPHLHTYAPVGGEPVLRDAIARRLLRDHDVELDAGCLQVVSGATVGLSVVCQALLDPGDEVLIPTPYWPLIRGTVASRGAVPVEVRFWERLSDTGFDAVAALEAAVTNRTAALYVNSPNNPTGSIL
ncbi:aminotransferase class I/II-fold pyridoxal phosphate-dependent enzyme, partial [Planctomycetota bacterium]